MCINMQCTLQNIEQGEPDFRNKSANSFIIVSDIYQESKN